MESQTSSGQSYWAENRITSQLHLVHFSPVFEGRGIKAMGVMACVKDHPSSQSCPQRRAKDGESTLSWVIPFSVTKRKIPSE